MNRWNRVAKESPIKVDKIMIQSIPFLKPLYHILKSQSLEKISETPFATHLPILLGIAHFFKIQKVLEFGSGVNSTIALMNRDYFPDITDITSYENDINWYNKMISETSHDLRVNLRYCEGDISKNVDLENISDYDLVFIDDSLTPDKRAATIKSVVSRKPRLLVIHDYENFKYRLAVGQSNKTFRFKGFLPNTGVYSSEIDIQIMEKINFIINKYKRTIKPYELDRWHQVLTTEA